MTDLTSDEWAPLLALMRQPKYYIDLIANTSTQPSAFDLYGDRSIYNCYVYNCAGPLGY